MKSEHVIEVFMVLYVRTAVNVFEPKEDKVESPSIGLLVVVLLIRLCVLMQNNESRQNQVIQVIFVVEKRDYVTISITTLWQLI